MGFSWFTRFLESVKAPLETKAMRHEHFKILFELREQMLELVQQEQPAQVFLQTLADGIVSGTLRFRHPGSNEDMRGRNYVGFERGSSDDCVFIFPREAMAQVRFEQERQGRKFDWTPNTVSKALYDRGALVRQRGSADMGTRVRAYGHLVRAWKIRKEFLGLRDRRGDDE
jgi:hypothetical protein